MSGRIGTTRVHRMRVGQQVMSKKQPLLFPIEEGQSRRNCLRCEKRCRVVDKINPAAQVFVLSDGRNEATRQNHILYSAQLTGGGVDVGGW